MEMNTHCNYTVFSFSSSIRDAVERATYGMLGEHFSDLEDAPVLRGVGSGAHHGSGVAGCFSVSSNCARRDAIEALEGAAKCRL